jgi:hypothetical protein
MEAAVAPIARHEKSRDTITASAILQLLIGTDSHYVPNRRSFTTVRNKSLTAPAWSRSVYQSSCFGPITRNPEKAATDPPERDQERLNAVVAVSRPVGTITILRIL